MLRRLRKWAWVVPVVALLMVGEALLLRRYYTARIAALHLPVHPVNLPVVHDSVPIVIREVYDPNAVWRAPQPSVPPRYDASAPPVDSLLQAADSAELVVMPDFERDVEDIIDSLQTALHEQEKVIGNLMAQLNRTHRQRPDSTHLRTRRRPANPSGELDGEVGKVVKEGRRVMDQRIRAHAIERHLDTLSTWRYHSPQLQQHILEVNTALYDYVETLRMTHSDSVVSQVRDLLLDYWQVWNDRIAEKIRKVKEEDKNER